MKFLKSGLRNLHRPAPGNGILSDMASDEVVRHQTAIYFHQSWLVSLCELKYKVDSVPTPASKVCALILSVERVASCHLIEVLLTAVGWSAHVKLASIWHKNGGLAWLSQGCCRGRNGIRISWERQWWVAVKVAGAGPDCLRLESQCCRFLVLEPWARDLTLCFNCFTSNVRLIIILSIIWECLRN